MRKWREVIIDRLGNGIKGATVTVYEAGTLTLATIYSDNGVTAAANPLTTSELGEVEFYAANGSYDITVQSGGQTVKSITDEEVYDLDDLAASIASFVETTNNPVANDIARFTDANTIEGRSYAEFKADLGLQDDLDGASLTDVGTPAAGDLVLLQDASDSNNLKVAQFSTFGGAGSGDSWGDAVDAIITPDADGTRDLATTGTRFATGYFDALDVTNNITVGGTVDGRDLATDGTKLDGIEASADVTDAANVTAAGALMDSEVANLAQVKAFDSADYATAAQGALADSAQQPPSEGAFVNGDKTKLDGIEAAADVTDAANVTAAGALMDSELASVADVKAIDQSVISGAAPTFATTNMTDATNKRFMSDAQESKLDGIEASADVTDEANVTDALDGATLTDLGTPASGDLVLLQDASDSNILKVAQFSEFGGAGSGDSWADPVDAVITPDADGTRDLGLTGTRFATGYFDALDVTNNITVGGTVDGRNLATDGSKLDGIEASADVTDTANVTAAGALMDSELASVADVKALDQSVISGAAPVFATTNMTDASNKRFMSDAQESKLDGIEASADVTDEANVTNALDGATLTDLGTPASGDLVLLQDASDSNNLKVAQFSTFGGGGGDAWADPVDAVITPDADGTRDLATTGTRFATGYLDAINITNNIVVGGTVDGRDVATDGTKLDGIEASADVTDETNVTNALDGATLTAVTVAGTDKVLAQDASDSDNLKTVTAQSIADLAPAESKAIILPVVAEATAVATGTGLITFRMPFAMTLTEVRASLVTAQTSGSALTVDINDGGTTILSTKLTFDNTEKTTETATTAPVISDTALADDAEITIDVDQIGDGTAQGLKVTLIGTAD